MIINKESGRLFVCSDLHGSIKVLKKLLTKVGFVEGKDTLIHCGDLVDRGEDSVGTIEHFVYDKTGSYFSCRGNHDQFLADAIRGELGGHWVYHNGGQWALQEESWKIKSLAEEAANLPVHITVNYHGKKYGFVHAEVDAKFSTWSEFTDAVDRDDALARQAMWSRDIIYGTNPDPLDDIEFVFHGHTPVAKPTIIGNRIYLDLGYVFKKLFCLMEITDTGVLIPHFRDKYGDKVLGEPFVIGE